MEAPTEKSFAEYFKELETKGKTFVPCPYGYGVYQIRVSGSHWYATPEIIFASNERCPMPFRDQRFAGRAFSVNGGRVIPWYPKWRGSGYRNGLATVGNVTLAQHVVRIILAGRKLYVIKCGQHISSLDNDDDKREHNYIKHYNKYGAETLDA